MSGFKFDPSRNGFRKVLSDWEELALRCVWSTGGEGAVSKAVWEAVNERRGWDRPISRASIIVALNRLVGWGVLGYREATGKGGYHRIYYTLMDEKGFLSYLLETMVKSMRRDFPEETRQVLDEYLY